MIRIPLIDTRNIQRPRTMNPNLFPYYGRYVRMMASGPVLFFLLVGGAIILYQTGAISVPVEVYSERAFSVILVVMFISVGITVVRQIISPLRCPHCGERSMRMEKDPPSLIIVSPRWKTQNVIAQCKSCGFQQQTDLQLMSNMFVKHFPVKIK